MTLTIPYGGFLVSQTDPVEAHALAARLADDRATAVTAFADHGVVLVAWTQFAGQGLWSQAEFAVAYDVQLTNLTELCRQVDLPDDGSLEIGRLIWLLYKKFGRDFVDKLRGAFAFALWDGRDRQLLVVTDFYGIRPVVYCSNRKGFAAASRIRQLALAGIDREINPEAIYHYLFFQAVCSPVSIYKDVHKLEPGRGLIVENRTVKPYVHYDLRYETLHQDEAYWRRAIPAAVEQAVGNYVSRDEPDRTGCFLSGGTDSSTIAGNYTRISGRPAKTFSIGFDDPQYNELDFARIAVNHFRTEQHEYLVSPADVLKLVAELPWIYDEPFGNASVVAAYYCAELAREQQVRTMLGGDGGDEIFGGNERYVTNLVFQRYADMPGLFRKGLFEPMLGLMPSTGLLFKAKRYVRRSNIPNPRRFYSYNLLAEHDNAGIFQADFLASIDTDCFFRHAEKLYERAAPAAETDRLLYIDMKNTITDNDLRKVTQMVEAAGIQVHYPLLDRDLVDFSCAIPPDLKVKPGQNRYIFKQAMRGFLPDEIIRKTKHGMGLPIAKWLKEDFELNALLEDALFYGEPKICRFVKPEYLHKLRKVFLTEETPYYGDSLWVFLMLELWLKHHFTMAS
jgi:asparagine synthase (glutamine-hydrolysing)